jgi:hypothetical protein
MTVPVSYPGVYFQEFAPGAPIAGVGTSTAGFIGVARSGSPNQPVLVTSFDQFRQRFDAEPMAGFYLWYAVRGFFENGGRRAYIVRASSGEHASPELLDSRATGAQTALLVAAQELGEPSSAIELTIAHSSLVTAEAFRPSAMVQQANTNMIQLTSADDAVQFRPTDRILISDSTNSNEGTIQAVNGTLLTLATELTNSYTSGTIRLVNLAAGDTSLRLNAAAADVSPGSVIAISQGDTSETVVVRRVQAERISPTLTTYRVEVEGLANGYDRDPAADSIEVVSQEFTMTVVQGDTTETRANLSVARGHSRYVNTVLATDPFALITVHEPDVPSNAAPAERRPAEISTQPLQGGAVDNPQNLTQAHYQRALDALRDVDDVNFVAIPDNTSAAVQMALLTHCEETMGDRFAIFDPPPGLSPTGPGGSILDQINLLRSDRGFGALYYPWILIPHPNNDQIAVPPSGHVAGIYARSDTQRGVHKAPANYTINGALGVVTNMNNETQGVLNVENINVLRVFPGQARPVVWGARTSVPGGETTWQYINIRRLFLFLVESIEEGIRWAVFEPNNLQLWQKLKRTISDTNSSSILQKNAEIAKGRKGF